VKVVDAKHDIGIVDAVMLAPLITGGLENVLIPAIVVVPVVFTKVETRFASVITPLPKVGVPEKFGLPENTTLLEKVFRPETV
jgi:hypothetical protein